jgi:hypothetical protein
VAVNDSYTTLKNAALQVSSSNGVLRNDTDPDGGTLTATIVTQPGHGTVGLNGDGSFTYAPANNFVGADSYTYKAKDPSGAFSNVATVTITVSPDGRRMTGGGTFDDKLKLTHGFELHCDPTQEPNNLEVNWDKGNKFHLDTLTSAACSLDPSINQAHPNASFNTYTGSGIGHYNTSIVVTANWTFTDAGEPGNKDVATLVLTDSKGKVIVKASGTISKGNQQAHD